MYKSVVYGTGRYELWNIDNSPLERNLEILDSESGDVLISLSMIGMMEVTRQSLIKIVDTLNQQDDKVHEYQGAGY